MSLAFLISAMVLFVAFHFLTGFVGEGPGWKIWQEIWRACVRPAELAQQPMAAIGIASFLNFTLLILVSPFLTQVWVKSRLAWWFATIFSGLATAGFWLIILRQHPHQNLASGGYVVLLAPLLNFFGLILAREKMPPAPEPPAI